MESFDCSVGPQADVKEFEYIAALQQTCPGYTRSSGTVSSLDIMRFLKSRYSLDITLSQASDIVLGLGGGVLSTNVRKGLAGLVESKQKAVLESIRNNANNNSNNNVDDMEQIAHHERWKNINSIKKKAAERTKALERENHEALLEEVLHPKLLYLDMVQMVSVLMIPTIARYTKEWNLKHHHATNNNKGVLASAYQDELGRVQSRLSSKNSGGGKAAAAAAPPSSLADEFASVEVGLSEMSYLGTNDNVSTQGGENAAANKIATSLVWQLVKTEELTDELSPKPTGLLEFVLGRMWNVVKQENNETNLKKMTTKANSGGGGGGDEENKNANATSSSGNGKDVATTESAIFNTYNNLLAGNSGEEPSLSSSNVPPMVTPELVKALLLFHGESERANDDLLVQQMVAAAYSPSGRFDEHAFCNAISSDLKEWNVGCEDQTSTCIYDVFGTMDLYNFKREDRSGSGANKNGAGAVEEPEGVKSGGGGSGENAPEDTKDDAGENVATSSARVVTTTNTADKKSDIDDIDDDIDDDTVIVQRVTNQIIDTVRDGFGSSMVLLLIWMTYVCHAGTYSSLVLALDTFNFECEEATIGCTLGNTIISWLTIAIMLSAFGMVVMIPISYGNHPTHRSPVRLLTSTLLTVAVTCVPFVIVQSYKKDIEPPYEGPEEVLTDDYFTGVLYLDMTLGLSVATIYFILFLVSVGKQWDLIDLDNTNGGILSMLWTTSEEIGSTRLKHAATRKINAVLTNARRMHGVITEDDDQDGGGGNDDGDEDEGEDVGLTKRLRDSQADPTFQNFLVHGERRQPVGSLIWTWKRVVSGEIFDHDGIWFPARMWIFQFGQVVIAIFISFALFRFTSEAITAADEANKDLDPDLPQWVLDLVPTGKEVKIALTPASIVAICVMGFIIITYVPSTTTTVLKFRSGHYPSLGSASFNIARQQVDVAHMNTANAIYGMTAAAGLFFVLIGLVIFLFIWDFSQDLMLLLLAWGIGLTITIVLKMLVTMFCRKRFYRAFYRTNPGRSNLSILALECWFIGLGGGVLIGRITQFLLAAAFWIGRIDEPFLADNVDLVGYKFDYVPLNYTKEILVHEAHRHPFIERLGTMYLMRLKNKNFGSDAGGCWRQLFVLTLMPWMVKNRVHHEQRCVEAVNDQHLEVAQKQVEEVSFTENAVGVGTGLVDTGANIVTGAGKGALDLGTGAVKGAVGVGTGAVKGAVDVGAGAVIGGAKIITDPLGVNVPTKQQ